tara:strand:+ start:285 stop:1928 length:1644 start_codon:yes stop_codon:yes gene_type:complete
MINLGHNNPPVTIKSIEFTNSAIEKLKIDNLDFGNKKFLIIPFNVPRGSHLKGLSLTVVKATKIKKFTLRFWLGGRSHEHNLGTYKPYRNSNDLGFTCVQANKKQYDIYNEHTNDKGLYLTNPKVADKIKDTKITKHQIEILDSLTLRDIIVLICEAGFPKFLIDGASLSRIHLASIFKFLAGYNWRAKHIRFGDDAKGNGIITFKVNPTFSRFNDKTKAPTSFKDLFKKFPSGKGILAKEQHFNPTGSISLYDDEFSKTMIKDLFNAELGPPLIETYLEKYKRYGTKRNCYHAISYLCNFALDKKIVKHKVNPCNLVKLKKPLETINKNSAYNEISFTLEDLKKIHKACLEIAPMFPYSTAIIMFIMVTGRRFQETSKIIWDYVKEDEGIIEIPKHINKIDVDQFITITEPVKFILGLLKAIPNRPGMENFKNIPWVFPSIRARVRTKDLDLDKQRIKTIYKTWCLIREKTGIVGSQRTLRKTFATLAKETLGATGPATNLTGHTSDKTLDAYYYKTNQEKIINDANTVGSVLWLNMPGQEDETIQ